MADQQKYVAASEKILSASISTSATTIALTELNSRDATALTMTDFGDIGFATLEPNGASMELISFTGISSTSLTGVTRGLGFEAPYTNVAALQLPHSAGSKLVFSNSPQLYNEFLAKDNDETILQTWTFTNPNYPKMDSATPAPTADEEFATKKYADDLAIAGAPDASQTVKGIVEIATDAELAAGTAAGGGGTTADLGAHAASFNETAAAAKVPVAESTGQLGKDWLGQTTRGDLLTNDGTDLTRLAVGTANYYLTTDGTDPSWGGANIDEANTFFGATDATGAEMETLTDGSNADALHEHSLSKIYDEFTGTGRRNAYFLNWDDSNFTTVGAAGGSTGVTLGQVHLSPDTDTGDAWAIYGTVVSNLDWDNDFELIFSFRTDQLTNQDIFIGKGAGGTGTPAVDTTGGLVAEDGVCTEDHVGIFVVEGILWASMADGTTQERTDITGALTLTNYNEVRIVYSASTGAVFYVNSSAALATLATQIPTGSSNDALCAGIEDHGAANPNLELARQFFFAQNVT